MRGPPLHVLCCTNCIKLHHCQLGYHHSVFQKHNKSSIAAPRCSMGPSSPNQVREKGIEGTTSTAHQHTMLAKMEPPTSLVLHAAMPTVATVLHGAKPYSMCRSVLVVLMTGLMPPLYCAHLPTSHTPAYAASSAASDRPCCSSVLSGSRHTCSSCLTPAAALWAH